MRSQLAGVSEIFRWSRDIGWTRLFDRVWVPFVCVVGYDYWGAIHVDTLAGFIDQLVVGDAFVASLGVVGGIRGVGCDVRRWFCDDHDYQTGNIRRIRGIVVKL